MVKKAPVKPAKISVRAKVVIVTWDDAVADVGWKEQHEADLPQRCTSIGMVVIEDDDCLVVAGTWGMNGEKMETNNRITIPRGWIIKQTLVNINLVASK
jgi:hypothetical protein